MKVINASSAGLSGRDGNSSISSNKRRIGGMRDVHAITGCIFLCTLTCYFERMGFSIAFTELAEAEGLNETVKGTVLSAFFYGYAVMQLPGSWLSARYGGARILGLSFALWGLFSLSTPGIHEGSTLFFFGSRVMLGASQGLFIPASHTLLARWIPVHERSKLVTLAMSGMYLGSAVSMMFVPYMVKHLGPEIEFKVSGVLALLWVALWLRVGSDLPSDQGDGDNQELTLVEEAMVELPSKKEHHTPLLSRENRSSHNSSTGGVGSASNDRRNPSQSTAASEGRGASTRADGIPWGVLFRSPAVWAIIINNFAFHYATYVLMNWLPTYFQSHVGVALSDMSSQYTVVPYVMMFFASNIGGSLGTWANVSVGKSIVFSRKLVNTLGFTLSVISLLLMTRATHWRDGVLYTTMALSSLGLSRGGWAVSHMDIAPRHAGAVMAIANGAGTLAGVVGVSWTGNILEAFGGPREPVAWSTALGAVSLICGAAMVTFLLFARGETLFH